MAAIVRLICPNLKCRAVLSVPATARGKTVKCRQCGMRIVVPKPVTPSAPVPPQPDPDENVNPENEQPAETN